MNIKVLAFGIAKEIFGGSSIVLDIPGNTTVDLKATLEQQFPRLKQLRSYMVAVNNEYAQDTHLIAGTDEIAIIPPVSGG
jgi:molybdopterin synthase sulfur carrier subunit